MPAAVEKWRNGDKGVCFYFFVAGPTLFLMMMARREVDARYQRAIITNLTRGRQWQVGVKNEWETRTTPAGSTRWIFFRQNCIGNDNGKE